LTLAARGPDIAEALVVLAKEGAPVLDDFETAMLSVAGELDLDGGAASFAPAPPMRTRPARQWLPSRSTVTLLRAAAAAASAAARSPPAAAVNSSADVRGSSGKATESE